MSQKEIKPFKKIYIADINNGIVFSNRSNMGGMQTDLVRRRKGLLPVSLECSRLADVEHAACILCAGDRHTNQIAPGDTRQQRKRQFVSHASLHSHRRRGHVIG